MSLKEDMEGSYYYETNRVGSTRKEKSCGICGKTIPVKSSHMVLKLFCDEFYDYNICPSCEKEHSNEISQAQKGEFDSY